MSKPSDRKRKSGAEKLREIKAAKLKVVANDPKQKKLNFKQCTSSNVSILMI